MADYSIQIIPISALSFSTAEPNHGSSPTGGGGGEGWSAGGHVFTYDASAIVTAGIVDTEPDVAGDGRAFGDDPGNPEWTNSGWTPHSQTLEAGMTVDGTDYPAGQGIENEYELNVTYDGVTYRLVAVGMSDPVTLDYVVIGYTFDGAWPPEGATLTSVAGTSQDGQETGPLCFCNGTLIDTPDGPRAVETLKVGDRVLTADGRAEPILWIGKQRLGAAELARKPKLRPIRIATGALGKGVPARDLRLSPQHRVLMRSPVVARKLGLSPEALVAVKHMVGMAGISVEADGPGTTYFHLLCEQHEVVRAEGAEVETLLPGPMALKSLDPAGYEEVMSLFPSLAAVQDVKPARAVLAGKMARHVMEAHRRHGRDLVAVA
jgi:hypothetical protein